MCIYLDVLIVLNTYVNYFLIKGTSKITHTPVKTWRCVLTSFIGSFFSLAILMPMSAAAGIGLKLCAAALIVSAAFGIKDKKHTLKLILCFYIVNFVFGGFVLVMYEIFKPSFMAFNNSCFYVDFSLLSLVVFTAAAYLLVKGLRFFLDRGCDISHSYRVIIKYENAVVSIDGIPDTGNSLVDAFSGKPVIICGIEQLSSIEKISGAGLAGKAPEEMCRLGFRLVPYSTIGNSGMMPVFVPDEIFICDNESERKKKVDALVGINFKETPAIFNPGLLV
jgi:stage II sporulation protein GA (sporulation sigma-E factor processing peptidase)